MEPTPPTSPPPARARRGCLFYGCLTLVLVLIGLVAIFGVGVYLGFQEIRKLSSPEPAPVPVYEAKPGEVGALEKRFREFEAAVAAGRPARLELSADDLNALLSTHAGRGKAFARIGEPVLLHDGKTESLIYVDGSFPFQDTVWPFSALEGRYLNGSLGLRPVLENGKLALRPETATVDGKPIPEKLLTLIQSLDVLEGAGAWAFKELERLGKELRGVQVEGGKLVIER